MEGALWLLLKRQGKVSDTKEAIYGIKEDIYAIVAELLWFYKQSSPYEQSFQEWIIFWLCLNQFQTNANQKKMLSILQ